MGVICIRGAVTAENNEREEILSKTEELLNIIIEANKIATRDILSIAFTMTRDLDKVYPAVAARMLGITDAALLCYQELYVEGSLNKCIRVMVTCESEKRQYEAKHIYLGGASALRPDLID